MNAVEYGADIWETDLYLCILSTGKNPISSQSPRIQYPAIHSASNNRVDGLFEYEEYISLKAVEYGPVENVFDFSDPNEGFETITELCGLLDQIHSLQKLIFAHFQPTSNNECRIAGLIPLVQES